MDNLNAAFNQHGIYFVPFDDPCSVNASYQVLNTTLSVTEIRNQIPAGVHANALDIYVTSDIGDLTGSEYSTPNNFCELKGTRNGILVTATEVLIHEIGHNLGLVHTFISSQTGGCDELPGVCSPEASCYCCGDYVCDTEFHTNANIVAPNCFNNNLPEHIVKNYMSYTTPGDCRDQFTPEQAKRMRIYLEQAPVLQAMQIKTSLPGATLGSTSGNIILNSGTYTISTPLSMLPNTSIWVKPGATLRIQATITGACGQMWQGIIVEGDPTDIQQDFAEQGRVIMFGAGKIEHALCGIDVQKTNYINQPDGGGGGIIEIYGGNFADNAVGIRFGPYTGLGVNKSRIVLANFTSTDNYRGEDVVPTFIKMKDVAKIPVSFSQFQDLRTSCTEPADQTTGIDAQNSGLSVLSSHFEDLRIGIRANMLDENNGSFIASGNDFSGCYRGVQTLSSSSFSIVTNNFTVRRPKECPALNVEIIGVKLEGNTSGFTFMGNQFSSDVNGLIDGILIGTDCSDLKDGMNNTIFDNTYNELWVGNRATGYNGYDNDGLLYICNQNNNILNADFDIPFGSVRKIQAGNNALGNLAPTGNSFTDLFFTKRFNNLGGFTVDYYYLANDPLQDPTQEGGSEGINPFDISFQNNNCGISEPCLPPCPEEEIVEQWKAGFQENKEAWLEKNANLPFISGEKQREEEQAAIRLLRLAMNRDASRILMHYSLDSSAIWTDTIVTWLQQIETYPTDLRLARHYFINRQFAEFDQLWDQLPARYNLAGETLDEYESMDSLYQRVKPSLLANELDRLPQGIIYDLTEWAAYCNETGYLARAVLWRNGIDVQTDCVGAGERTPDNALEIPVSSLLLFPNPTRQWLNANFPASPFETNLSLFNTHGQCIHQTLIPAFSKEVALPVQGLPSGIYLVQHNVGGVIQTAKVLISY